jgi:hydrogenase-4 component B
MDQETLLLAGFAILGVGALVTLLARGEGWQAALSRYTALAAVLASGACFATLSARLLSGAAPVLGPIVLWEPSFVRASLAIRVDALSAFFLLIVSGLSAAAAWYAVGYTRKMGGGLGGFYPPLLLFVFGMAGVLVVDDFFFFLVPWEVMALSSYLLVIYHKDEQATLAAGFKYFFITHAGTLALFFGVAMIVATGRSSFGFEAIAAAMPALLASRPLLAHFALLLIFLGFLVKAGGYPFGMWWLPDAHPAAPTPASALLSGVMIKLGLYGILRVFFDIMPAGPWVLPWGLLIATFGTASLLFGTLSALLQHDSKRLLAFSSIGQVGYILLGFGIGLALLETNPGLAAIGLIGGLFHLLNHACFKGLLFLNAGAFEFATGERRLDFLGGLGRVLPITAVSTMVASFSIAGLPPFNGFASKWLLYHSSIWGSQGSAVILLLFGITAIFVSAVTLALFLKFMGATIWGTPSPVVARITRRGDDFWLGSSQGVLALLCVGLGLFPYAGIWLSHNAAGALRGMGTLPELAALFGTSALALEVRDAGAVVGLWSPIVLGAIFAGTFLLALLIRGAGGASRRVVPTWNCGSEVTVEETRFRADHYYTPFKRFARMLVPDTSVSWRPRRWPVVERLLNPDGWGYNPILEKSLAIFRWFTTTRLGLPQVYPAWNLIGLAGSFVIVIVVWWLKGS